MISFAIVEDNSSYQLQLAQYLKTFMRETGEVIEVHLFSDGDEITEGYTAKYDIILMDIQMKFMDGISAAAKIREIDKEVVIIFITNSAHYAIKGYEVDAFDYVVKPISYFAFSQKINRAIGRLKNRQERFIRISVKGGQKRLKISDIYYFESEGHTVIMTSKEEKVNIIGTLKELEAILEKEHFFRGNRSYLINLAHVDGVQGDMVSINGEELLLSRPKKGAFMEALTNYWAEVIK